jgi:hypothetical protein
MLLHRRATADPSVPFELRAGGVVLASAMITSRALPSIFPFTDESMWQMI